MERDASIVELADVGDVNREAAAEFSDRMQEYLRGMLEKEIGKKFKKFHKNVDNQYLADKFRGVGGTRW